VLLDIDLTDDPFIARCEKLIRVGGVLPPLSAILALMVLRVVGGGRVALAMGVGAFAALGQGIVWAGMRGLKKSRGWASGVLFYLILGGVLSALTLFLTGIPALMPIPLIAPTVGCIAKRRLQRFTRRETPQ
jgi:hypothetical protein